MPPKSEVEKYLEGLPPEDTSQVADIFAPEVPAGTTPEEGTTPPPTPEEGDEHKNRRHRRWEARLAEKERELELKMARLEGLSEAQAAAPANVDPRLVEMYGDNTAAIKLHQDLLQDFAKKAEEQALERWEQRQADKAREDAQLESFINEELEAIEDEFSIDLTSNAPAARKARTEYLDLVEKLSPKDQDGLVSDFADFRSTWDIYQTTKKATPSASPRARDLAALSMERSGTGSTPPKAPTPGFDGWKKDLGIG